MSRNKTEDCPQWLQIFLKEQEKNRALERQADIQRKQEEDHRRAEEMNTLREIITSVNNSQQSSSSQVLQQPQASNGEDVRTKLPTPARPSTLDIDISYSKFISWRESWEDYAMLQKFEKLPLTVQKADFRSCLSEEMRQHLKCAIDIVADDENISLKDILDKIQQHLRLKRNEAIDRVAFENLRQDDHQTFDEFYVALKKLAIESDLCKECVDSRLVTKIMAGVNSQDIRQKLLSISPFPDLKTVVDLCRSHETSMKDCEALSNGCKIDRVYKKYTKNDAQEKCQKCGREKHSNDVCPARNSTCHTCDKIGHWTEMCYNKGKFKNNKKQKNKSYAFKNNPNKVHALKVSDIRTVKENKTPKVNIEINFNQKIKILEAIPDTGAEITVCGMNTMKKLGIKRKDLDVSKTRKMTAANGTEIEYLGEKSLSVKINQVSTTETFAVCKNQYDILLSWKLCRNLKLIPNNFPKQIEDNSVKVVTNKEDLTAKQLKTYLLNEYHDVFNQTSSLKLMNGEPMKIHLNEDAKPFAIYTARQIPHAYKDEVKETLDKMVKDKIIEPLKDEPAPWCHPMVVVQKPKGGIRVCIDMTKLNENVQRPVYPTLTPKQAVGNISPGSKYFSTLDAKSGYWQIPLEKSAQPLTTFLTPWGRYKYLRAPMGLASTGDEYCRRGDEAFSGMKNYAKVVDDIIVYDENLQEHYENVRNLLERCRKHNITLNREKFKFAEKSVKYVGYTISEDGITVDEEKLEGLRKFPEPRNISELRSFMGLVNQFGDFSKQTSGVTAPLRPLLSKKNVWNWLPEHQVAFEATKDELCKSKTLKHFDPEKKLILHTDASRLNGLGYALFQEHDGKLFVIQCGSRYLNDAESRYAAVELELLAIVYAVQKCKIYLIGNSNFTVVVDHRPLLSILDRKRMDEIENSRLQRFKEKLSLYKFSTEWRSGKSHKIPDALSRAPVSKPENEDQEDVMIQNINFEINCDSNGEDPLLNKLKLTASNDDDYRSLRNNVLKGFPSNRSKIIGYPALFWNSRHYLSVENDLVLFGNRVVVPKTSQKEVLKLLHQSHQGIERTKRRARQMLFWPGMNNDIETTVRSCIPCQEKQYSQQKETLLQPPLPSRVFQEVSMDFFTTGGKEFLVYTDRYSNWPVLFKFKRGDTSTKRVIEACRKCFADLGVPEKIRTDGGPQFKSSEFKRFLDKFGVIHITSSPHHHQANGDAESAVKSMKNLVIKCTEDGNIDSEEFLVALLEWRNTPGQTGYSPAQILFGSPMRTLIPAHHRIFDKKWHDIASEHDSNIAERRRKDKIQFDKHSKDLPELNIGDEVRIQDAITKKWDRVGNIIAIGKFRDYSIKLPSGRLLWRNRIYLKKILQNPTADDVAETVPPPPRRSTRKKGNY